MSAHPTVPTWVESGGGPLVILPASLATQWQGTLPYPAPPVSGDYARAVQVTDFLGRISLGAGMGLVLGGEPLPTTMWRSGQALVIARWMYAPSDETAVQAVRNADTLHYKPENIVFQNDDDTVVLMDAASTVENATDILRVGLPRGTYAASTSEYKPDEETFFLMHRLEQL